MIMNRRHLLAGLSALGAASLGLSACSSARARAEDGQTIGHVVVGDGPEPVVVLHEWLGDHSNYDPALPYLSVSRFSYVFADLRGYGLSRQMTGDYSLEEAAADVGALMDRLGHRRFHVVGHSMSGMIAQYLMTVMPDRVKSVVAISPVPASGFKTDAAGLAKLDAVITDDDAARNAIRVRTGNRYGTPWLDRKLAVIRRASPQAMRGYMAMFTGNDFSARAQGCPIPISVICGDQDIPFYGKAAVEPKFRAWYPRLQIAAIHDAGHYSMLETPVYLASLVDRALSGDSWG